MKKVLKITSVFLILMVTLLLLSTASNAAIITKTDGTEERIDLETKYESLAALLGSMSEEASSLTLYPTDTLQIGDEVYIGSEGLLKIDNGSIDITYDVSTSTITLTINGDVSTTDESSYIFYMRKWSVGNDTVPMNIIVKSGSTLNINCGNFEVCDTSVLTVEEGGTVNISESSTVTVATGAQITGAGTLNNNGTLNGSVDTSLTVVTPTDQTGAGDTPDEEEATGTEGETTEEATGTEGETTEEATGTEGETTEEATETEDETTTEEATETEGETTEEATETEEETTSNPTTGDAIIVFAVVFVIAVAGIVVTIKMRKRAK